MGSIKVLSVFGFKNVVPFFFSSLKVSCILNLYARLGVYTFIIRSETDLKDQNIGDTFTACWTVIVAAACLHDIIFCSSLRG